MTARLSERLGRLLGSARHAVFGSGNSRLYQSLRNASFRGLYLLSGGKGRLVQVAGRYPLYVEWERIAVDFEKMEAGFTLPFGAAIKEGMSVFDIGASLGEWSALAGSRSPTVKVHVFEPNGPSWSRVKKIFELNGLAMPAGIFQGFVADKDDLAPEQRESARAPRWPAAVTGNAEFEDVRRPKGIPSITLDSYCLLAGAAPDVIKIDVEGAEGLVLRGAMWTLREHRPVVFLSLHPWLVPSFGDTTEGIKALLTGLGYRWEMLSVDHEEHWLAVPE